MLKQKTSNNIVILEKVKWFIIVIVRFARRTWLTNARGRVWIIWWLVHAGCVDISKAVFKGLVSGNDTIKIGLMWFCEACIVRVMGFISKNRFGSQTTEDIPKV